MLKDRTAIVGIGQTRFAKSLDEPEKTLACRAVLAALDDAGIDPADPVVQAAAAAALATARDDAGVD